MSEIKTQWESEGSRAPVSAAVISADPSFRGALKSILMGRDTGVLLDLEIELPIREIADPELE